MEKRYNLEMNEAQVKIIQVALEEYFRVRMNQWGELAEDLASVGFIYDKEGPNNHENFQKYIDRREKTEDLLKKAMMEAQPDRNRKAMPVSDNVLIAEDIWQVIRYQLYLDSKHAKNEYNVASRPPFAMSSEELPTITSADKSKQKG